MFHLSTLGIFITLQATGARVGIVLQSLFGMVAGITIALYFGWKLALAVMAMVPILVIAGK
jgi:hypothetical protein